MTRLRTLAYFVQINLINGDFIGFSDFNQDLTFNGVTYYATNTTEATASSQNLGLNIDNIRIKLLIDTPDSILGRGITERHLRSGILDDSPVRVFLADYTNPTVGQITILNGFIGESNVSNGYLDIEVNSTTQKLSRGLSRVTSPVCPFEFGGAECALNLPASGLEFANVPVLLVTELPDRTNILLNHPGFTAFFQFGFIEVETGSNRGMRATILDVVNNAIAINDPLLVPLTTSDTVTIRASCAKTRNACTGYNNILRFGGFFVGGNWNPGIDGITFAGQL